jgi:hypothetical protein
MIFISAPENMDAATDAAGRLHHFRRRSGIDLVFAQPHEQPEFASLRRKLWLEQAKAARP